MNGKDGICNGMCITASLIMDYEKIPIKSFGDGSFKSLNKMDYDYFNYLFTLLKFNTFDVEKMGSVEFVYRIYDPDRANEIRNNYADAIYDVLNYYEGYVSKTNQNILINLLRFSGKLTIRPSQSS